MISIKMDIKSPKDEKNQTGEWGYMGKKSQEEAMDIEMLMKLMVKRDTMGIHECLIGDKYRPYADVDAGEKDGITEENFREKQYEILKAAMETMQKPDGTWKVSGHLIGNNIYYTDKEHIRYKLEQAENTEYFDFAVYNTNHLFCLPYCTKPGDKRRLRYAEPKTIKDISGVFLEKCPNEKCKKCPKFKDCDTIDESTLASGLITLVDADEKKMPVPKGYKPKEKKKKAVNDEDEEDSDDEDEDWSNWTYQKALAVIERLADHRADTHDKRTRGICSIIHLGRVLKKMRKFRELGHLFAKKDPDYSEDKTNEDWDYFKARKTANPRTFASLIKLANEDNPVMKEPEITEDTDIPLTYYDQIHEILHTKTTTLTEVKLYLMGCIRLCFAKGVTIWYQRSTDGWWRIENAKNFPFSDLTTNEKFKDTTLMEVMEGLKGTKLFRDRCMTGGEEFYPWYGVNDRPGIINTFRGWPHIAAKAGPETKAVKLLKDHLIMLFGDGFAKYFIGTLAKKLQNPRWRNHKLIVAFGKVGGEGKNLLERIISRVFGQTHVLTSQGTKDLLGEGEAGYNPEAECALLVFVNEAEKAGKSIVSNEKFKTWITENIQRIRRMRQAAIFTPNYGIGFMWTNHRDFLKADPAFLRRLRVAMCSDEKIWDKAYFDTLAALIDDAQGIQEIFNWLINYDVSTFDSEESPASTFLETLKADSLTPLQRFIVEVANGERIAERGDSDTPTKELYKDFQQWCSDNGMPSRKVPEFSDFTADLEMIDIPVKQVRIVSEDKSVSKPRCFILRIDAVEQILQKMQRNQKWKLLHDE